MENRQLDILQTTDMMFGAAAGGQYLSEFTILASNLGNSAVTVLVDIETYELADDSTNARTVTLNSNALTLIANNIMTDTVTVNAAALTQNAALTIGASASSLIADNLTGDMIATDLTGTLTITTADAADNGISIATGSAATAVNVAAGAASDTVSIDATAIANNT